MDTDWQDSIFEHHHAFIYQGGKVELQILPPPPPHSNNRSSQLCVLKPTARDLNLTLWFHLVGVLCAADRGGQSKLKAL